MCVTDGINLGNHNFGMYVNLLNTTKINEETKIEQPLYTTINQSFVHLTRTIQAWVIQSNLCNLNTMNGT